MGARQDQGHEVIGGDRSMNEPTTRPRYEHDCTTCVYLGTITLDAPTGIVGHVPNYAGTYDLYYHDHQLIGGEPTIIARYSGSGPDYYSGLVFGQCGAIAPLVAAYAIAVVRGLIRGKSQ